MSEPTCENCSKTKTEHVFDLGGWFCTMNPKDKRKWKPAAPASRTKPDSKEETL